jgi:hypothetical protein
MFLAGVPYRDIGKNSMVQLSVGGVHKVIKRQMALSATRREFLADNAYDVHIERLESLFAANYQVAVNAKANPSERLKAGELCRRLLDQLGKVNEVGGFAGSAPPPSPDLGDDEDDDPNDDLGAYRKRTRGA